MINKLRKKIFWIIQIPLSIILLGIIIIFTGFSYKNTVTSSTMFMDRLGRREEKRSEQQKSQSELKPDKDPFDIDIEGIYKIRIDNDSVVRESNDVTDEIRNYAIQISNKNSEEGYIEKYIYSVRKIGDTGKEVTLIENESAINRFKTSFRLAFVFAFLGLVFIYIIAKVIKI